MTAVSNLSSQAHALDGRRFDGIVLERGKTAGDADTLTFDGGRFRSTACDRYDYGDGAYTATVSAGEIAFESETESAKYGKLLWRGVVRGPRMDGHADDGARRRRGRREVDPGRAGAEHVPHRHRPAARRCSSTAQPRSTRP